MLRTYTVHCALCNSSSVASASPSLHKLSSVQCVGILKLTAAEIDFTTQCPRTATTHPVPPSLLSVGPSPWLTSMTTRPTSLSWTTEEMRNWKTFSMMSLSHSLTSSTPIIRGGWWRLEDACSVIHETLHYTCLLLRQKVPILLTCVHSHPLGYWAL